MVEKKCIGERLENAVDTVVTDVEKEISAARGIGSVTEDKYNEMMVQIDTIRESNNKLKCMIENIPKSDVYPEKIIEEMGV